MNDLAFYNAGGHGTAGIRQGVVLVRRVLRRILRPIFVRQVEILQSIVDRLDRVETLAPRVETHEHAVFALRVDSDAQKERLEEFAKRQEEVAEMVQTALAFGWDYVALVRRLATLEDQLAILTGVAPSTVEDGDGNPSILFPGLDKIARDPAATAADIHAKVS